VDPIEWRPDWSVGHDELDEQHQMLLELYNRFASAAAQGKGSRQVAGLLDALVEYTELHFATEERVLAEHGYAGLDRHRALHQQLVGKLAGFRQDLAAGRRFTADFRRFLGYWWQEHILEHDKDYGQALFGAPPADNGRVD
jgi:hemerythrin